ncbi:transposase [Sutterella wadsworthensis]|nr:transposase [Sutterella wadsworthensis]
MPFFAFSGAIRRLIYKTNSIECLNRTIRKTIKTWRVLLHGQCSL